MSSNINILNSQTQINSDLEIVKFLQDIRSGEPNKFTRPNIYLRFLLEKVLFHRILVEHAIWRRAQWLSIEREIIIK